MKISATTTVLNEVEWIGYSIMAAAPYLHEFIYALDANSNDGTRELLAHIKQKYLGNRITVINVPNFHPTETQAYNESLNVCVRAAQGDACMFLHPDMIITEAGEADPHALAWYTHMTSFARDMNTVITEGRATKWKIIHAKKFGLHYYGVYGSQNEDFYHSEITGKSYKHYGEDFLKYPYQVGDSHIKINHYCELRPYKRRLEKMKLCLKALSPNASDAVIEEAAVQHPRVTLEPSSKRFGTFKFTEKQVEVPKVFEQYQKEFSAFIKEPDLV